MSIQYKEGDLLPIPCRRCASLSIEVPVRSGTASGRCARCGGVTRITIRRAGDGWDISTELDPSGPQE